MSITVSYKHYSNYIDYYSYIIGDDVVSVDNIRIYTKKPHILFKNKVKLERYVIRWMKPVGLPLSISSRLRLRFFR